LTSTLDRRTFGALGAARAARSGPDAEEYWTYHRARLWDSYRRAARLLPEGGSFVSVGAGPGYVESGLARSHGGAGTIIDFPETLDAYAAHYAAAGLKAHAIDLTTRPTLASVVGTNFDLALSLEVVEHLPIPPSEHLAPIVEVLRPGGALLLSTPNAGNLRSALKTLLHRPTLPPAEQAFAVVGHENEGVHRREYMRSEIVEAFERCGLTVTGTGWVSYGRHDGADTIFLPIEWLIPRWRLTMAITGVTKSA
jgi:2-polyprenyl-3-methyl-5-hydroxy-6-metoxy-1,4-benzoquinol methylase